VLNPGVRRLGRLPERYAEPWRAAFDRRVEAALVPGVKILDVGSGRRPTIPAEQRPSGTWYAGLDLSRSELEQAPPGSYDEWHVADVARPLPELEGRFDVIVSWQVLEHVRPLAVALEHLRAYLRPGGRMVAQLSGRFSAFGLINMAVPPRLGVVAMQRLLNRDPETVFPAYYDHCTYRGLAEMLRGWSEAEIVPRYGGAGYFRFFRPAQAAYLLYEDWACRGGHRSLATHYLIAAVK